MTQRQPNLKLRVSSLFDLPEWGEWQFALTQRINELTQRMLSSRRSEFGSDQDYVIAQESSRRAVEELLFVRDRLPDLLTRAESGVHHGSGQNEGNPYATSDPKDTEVAGEREFSH